MHLDVDAGAYVDELRLMRQVQLISSIAGAGSEDALQRILATFGGALAAVGVLRRP
jgi:hypothetical protein